MQRFFKVYIIYFMQITNISYNFLPPILSKYKTIIIILVTGAS